MLFASSASNDCECTNTLAHKGLRPLCPSAGSANMEAPLLHERRPRTRAWVRVVDVLLAIAAIGALASGAALVEVSGLPSSWPWDDGGRRWPAFASAAAAALLALVLLGRLCFRAAGPPDRSPLDLSLIHI